MVTRPLFGIDLQPVELSDGRIVYAEATALKGMMNGLGSLPGPALGSLYGLNHPNFGRIPLWVPVGSLGATPATGGALDPFSMIASSLPGFAALTEAYHQDNLFIRHRDAVMKTLTDAGFPISDWNALFNKHKLAHKDIPDRKYGKDYGPEFARLHDFVREYLNVKQAPLGDIFYQKAWEIAASMTTSDPSRSYKGAADEGLKFVLQNAGALLQQVQVVQQQQPSSSPQVGPFVPEQTNAAIGWVAGGVLLLAIAGTWLYNSGGLGRPPVKSVPVKRRRKQKTR